MCLTTTLFSVAAIMMEAHWHTYQVLTKRSERLRDLLNSKLRFAAAAPHIWWGVSVEDRKYGLPRIEHLRSASAKVRFLSIEPLLENLGDLNLAGIHWMIVGGESGPGARPMSADSGPTASRTGSKSRGALLFSSSGAASKSPRLDALLRRENLRRISWVGDIVSLKTQSHFVNFTQKKAGPSTTHAFAQEDHPWLLGRRNTSFDSARCLASLRMTGVLVGKAGPSTALAAASFAQDDILFFGDAQVGVFIFR